MKTTVSKPSWQLLLGEAAYHTRPNRSSRWLTGVLFLTCLTVSQHAVQFLLQWHPHVLFQTAKHRQIVARYVGVDALCCIIMVWAGVSAIRSPSSPYGKKWHPDEYSQRLYAYYPTHYRVALFFTYYQIKDLMDSILWNDKPELIFHHILSLLSAYGCWSTETGLYYAPFFFGYSELSTIALCCLVNFDLELGIPGLADAFPRLKLIVGVLFVLLFLLCRCLAWPYVSYYFCRDVQQALRRTDDPQLKHRKFWLYFFLVALSGLSLLQVLWLGQIVVTAQKEFLK
ncbi:hypothetical protein FisN_14Hu204 [Fistulifera solaris]|uniref:TLC domain-containing protein n=1 Tax=Fistulifera solaris TaxID=1519565 RepID=A0A1Z5K8N8_FISSO|nr:hypothetical protein FisN_14Hu204 [Fistulifera solaris]|eukprot:GAX22576.1 hypothetical protein FisN_14Hu204 [Fistulifera solaris]